MRTVGVVSHQSLGEDEETLLIRMEPLYSPSNEAIGRGAEPSLKYVEPLQLETNIPDAASNAAKMEGRISPTSCPLEGPH
jgi:hypothetical protein